jgi:hypothetical protein
MDRYGGTRIGGGGTRGSSGGGSFFRSIIMFSALVYMFYSFSEIMKQTFPNGMPIGG